MFYDISLSYLKEVTHYYPRHSVNKNSHIKTPVVIIRIYYFYYVEMVFRNLLYFIAVLLLVGWVLGYLVWKHQGSMVHIMLVIAVTALILGVTRKVKPDQ